MFNKNSKNRLKLYRSFLAEDEDETFLDKMNLKRLPSILGDSQFINAIKDRFFEQKRHIKVPDSKRLAPDGDDIINAVCKFYSIDNAQLKSEELVWMRMIADHAATAIREIIANFHHYLISTFIFNANPSFILASYP
jgi:hypothetical protein